MFLKKNSLFFLVIILFVMILGRFWSSQGMEWYYTLNLSPLTPPGWVFGIVWPVLYGLLVVYASYIWNKVSNRTMRNRLMLVFSLNILLNILWTFLFFNQHSIKGALLVAVALWITTFVLMLATLKINRAAMLLLPYLLWLSFALYLNYEVWILN